MVRLIKQINFPHDLRKFKKENLKQISDELRDELIEVELCAAPKGSYSLSDLFVNPERPFPCLIVRILSFLPVKILWG